MFFAARECNRKLVDALVKSGVNALNLAAGSGLYNIPLYLLRAGADCNVLDFEKRTPLFYAARDGHRELVEALMNAGAYVDLKDTKGLSPLYFAARSRHFEIAINLVRAGADCNVVDEDQWSPLFYAARDGHRELVEALINAGAFVDFKDTEGLSPLYFAALNSRFKIAIDLVRAGADCNVADEVQWSPLFYAARAGHRELVEALVNKGAHVNLIDREGYSPVHIAAAAGHDVIAVYLVRSGADFNVIRPEKWIPILNAVRDGHKEPVEYFIKSTSVLDYWESKTEAFLILFIFLVKYGSKSFKTAPFAWIFRYLDFDKKKIIIKHYLLFYSDSVCLDFCGQMELVQFWSICKRQVEELKCTLLGSSTISLFKFMMENDENQLVNYLSGDCVTEALEAVLTVNRIPVYNEMIESQFLSGKERKFLFQSVESLVFKYKFKMLPLEVRYLIYSYMSNCDLLNFRNCFATSKASSKCSEKLRGFKRKISQCIT